IRHFCSGPERVAPGPDRRNRPRNGRLILGLAVCPLPLPSGSTAEHYSAGRGLDEFGQRALEQWHQPVDFVQVEGGHRNRIRSYGG
ncbi:AAEL007740-PA, partial [Aedes aegypti]